MYPPSKKGPFYGSVSTLLSLIVHYQPVLQRKDKLVAGWVLYEEGESADTVLDCGTLCLLDNNRELKHQTFSRGRQQLEVKFTSGPHFRPTLFTYVIMLYFFILPRFSRMSTGDSYSCYMNALLLWTVFHQYRHFLWPTNY